MSRSLSRVQAMVLGIVVLLSLILGGTGLLTVGSKGWFGKDAVTVKAGFDSIRGVEVGTRVRIQGIDAGEVVALEAPSEPGGLVFLCLRLKSDYRHLVRSTSRVQIISEGLIGGKIVEVQPVRPRPGDVEKPIENGMVLAAAPSLELTDVVSQAGTALQHFTEQNGTIQKLARDTEAHDALVAMLQQGKETLAELQRVSEAAHRLPLVGGYVENPIELLERPRFRRERSVYNANDLFEAGQAVLSDQGKQHLDSLAVGLNRFKMSGSELVIVSYADPQMGQSPAVARNLTRQQSEAVADYLKTRHQTHRLGWFSSRRVTPLGQGTSPPPSPEVEPVPPARIEVLLFVPVPQA